jgi:hypothetical protein
MARQSVEQAGRPDYRIAGRFLVLSVLAIFAASGCASDSSYRYAGEYFTECDPELHAGEPQVERGRKAPVLDTVGWIIGIPSKILLLNHRVNNHDVSPETEECLQEYLAKNDLDRVKVRVNEYDPAGEWRRLRENESICVPIRYTVGTLSVVGYTLFPGRIWGGDQYNPFTNTINVYSDVPAVALYKAGYAKDYAQREYKGLYAVGYIVPGVGLWQECKASHDALAYVEENGTGDDVKAGYRGVLPLFCYNAFSPFSINGLCLGYPALLGGHVVGQSEAIFVKDAEYPLHEATESETVASAETVGPQ